jgi:hypothetical protein
VNGVFVFLGPTLPVEQARAVLDATYLPPVAMGDLHALMARRPRLVAIVDGLFEQTPAVWHKEVLHALSRGVRVFGSSSMGALRAAELAAFGMEGVGRIFQAFHDGALEDDDEVAVAHGPAQSGFRALSEAMVNLRAGLEAAERAGLISAATASALVALGKAMLYPDRSWSALVAAGTAAGLPAAELEALGGFVRRAQPDQKRDDALELLRRVRDEVARGLTPHRATFQFEPTTFWLNLVATAAPVPAAAGAGEGGSPITAERVRNHLLTALPDRQELLRAALFLHLVRTEAERAGVTVDRAARDRAAELFRRRRGLISVAATNAWMARNRLSRVDFAELVELEALADALVARFRPALHGVLFRELQRQDRFGELVSAVEDKWRYLGERGLSNATAADAGLADEEELLSWYQARTGAGPATLGATLEGHARELGFDSERALKAELYGQYIFEKGRSE